MQVTLAASCMLGLSINHSTFVCTRYNDPLTTSVAGSIKARHLLVGAWVQLSRRPLDEHQSCCCNSFVGVAVHACNPFDELIQALHQACECTVCAKAWPSTSNSSSEALQTFGHAT